MNPSTRPAMWAYILPFGIFMCGLALVSLVKWVAGPSESLLLKHPEFWIYPVQTIASGIAAIYYRKHYTFDFHRGIGWAVLAALLSLAIWVSPQWLLGFAARNDGFNPDLLANGPFYYWLVLSMRFVRLVIVVPFVEEIFWRGFLMRYLIREDFEKVPFGQYALFSFGLVAVMFGVEHWGPDLIPGILTGVLFNAVAVKTRSLGACVIAHAITNLGLGWYIMATKQWGFW